MYVCISCVHECLSNYLRNVAHIMLRRILVLQLTDQPNNKNRYAIIIRKRESARKRKGGEPWFSRGKYLRTKYKWRVAERIEVLFDSRNTSLVCIYRLANVINIVDFIWCIRVSCLTKQYSDD